MIYFTNPKRAGECAHIKIVRQDGNACFIRADFNARKFAERHPLYVIERAGRFFAVQHSNPMASLFARCKGRVEAIRKINGMEDAVWCR